MVGRCREARFNAGKHTQPMNSWTKYKKYRLYAAVYLLVFSVSTSKIGGNIRHTMAHLWLRSNWNLWSTNSSSFLQPRVRFQQLDCSNEARFAWCKGHIITALQIEGICSWPTTRTRILLHQLAKVEVMGRSSILGNHELRVSDVWEKFAWTYDIDTYIVLSLRPLSSSKIFLNHLIFRPLRFLVTTCSQHLPMLHSGPFEQWAGIDEPNVPATNGAGPFRFHQDSGTQGFPYSQIVTR